MESDKERNMFLNDIGQNKKEDLRECDKKSEIDERVKSKNLEKYSFHVLEVRNGSHSFVHGE